jgi:hypothetical protein
VSKETYYSVKRDLVQCQKRPEDGDGAIALVALPVSETLPPEVVLRSQENKF